MKKTNIILGLLIIISNALNATNHTINTLGMSFVPSTLTINVGDSVTFVNTSGSHNVNGTIATFPLNPASFSNPTGVSAGWTYVHVFTLPGTYKYQCDPHIPAMQGTITVLQSQQVDCNGIVNGPALVDTCGTCHKAYIYNFITHAVNFIDDTNGVVLGANDIVVLPDNPQNPYWNDCGGNSNTIYDIVSNSADHTTLKTAIDACSLDGTLSGSGPFTLFAPTNAAFDALPAGTLTNLLNDIPQLTDILKHHVVGDSVMSGMLSDGQVVTTLNNTSVTVTIPTGMVHIDNAMVTVADIVADNGVVHVIDAVLLPTTTEITNIKAISEKRLVKVIDLLGRDRSNYKVYNSPLIYLFNDGSIEKKMPLNK